MRCSHVLEHGDRHLLEQKPQLVKLPLRFLALTDGLLDAFKHTEYMSSLVFGSLLGSDLGTASSPLI